MAFAGDSTGNTSLLEEPAGSQAQELFEITPVQLMFSLSDVVSMDVSNNVLCLGLKSGRIVRIDLDHPESVDEVDLPRKVAEIGVIAAIFLDPTGSHLLITTTLGENFTLHFQSVKVKHLSRLKGIVVTSVAWSPFEPARSTGEILLGTADGAIVETFIEQSNEHFKREDRYIRQVWKSPFPGEPITGLAAFQNTALSADHATRQVVAASNGRIWFWSGKFASRPSPDGIPLYTKFFDNNEPAFEEFGSPQFSTFATSPLKTTFAAVNQIGVLHSRVTAPKPGTSIFESAQFVLYDHLDKVSSAGSAPPPIRAVSLTEYHIILLMGSHVVAVNRLNNQVRYKVDLQLEPGETLLGLCADSKYVTYWAYSDKNIYEIKVGDEEQEIWKTLVENGEYEEALKLVKDAYSRDVVSTAYGQHLLRDGQYEAAAKLLGPTTKPFESIALELLDHGALDALLIFLSERLKLFRNQRGRMQRTIITSWMMELFMEKFDKQDDHIAAIISLSDGQANEKGNPTKSSLSDRSDITKAFHKFVENHKGDFDKSIVYEIISAHGRRDELLYYASAISDTSFVLAYWIRLEQWSEALSVLRLENDVNLIYKYATVLLVNSPVEAVETWMRVEGLDSTKLVPAILSYIASFRGPLKDNQAVRYLKFVIDKLKSRDATIHNTLVSVYASSSGQDETPLLSFLQSNKNLYDEDFALRVCSRFNRIHCMVHIYSSMGLYEEAVRLALKKGDVELACVTADRPVNDVALRKNLWLEVARHVIGSHTAVDSKSAEKPFASATELLQRCDLLKIEDLLPMFPEFTVIDDLRTEVISSMEAYNTSIGHLNREMEESLVTAKNIKEELGKFRKRYVLIAAGGPCGICGFPLATRRFYVFPCQHAFHFDCLFNAITKSGEQPAASRLLDAQLSAKQSSEVTNAVDDILTEKCVLCSESRLDSIDSPLVLRMDKVSLAEWAV